MLKKLVAVSILILVFGCSMPETKIFSINTQSVKEAGAAKPLGSLMLSVDAPRYLSQPYIAYRESPFQVGISKYSKWESSPSDILKELTTEMLLNSGLFKEIRSSALRMEGYYFLSLKLKRFERAGTEKEPFGELEFAAELLSPEGNVLYRGETSKKVKLEDRSFLSLAKGLSSASSEAVRELRASIEKTAVTGKNQAGK